ncbi:MAG TPA: AmmeMemoRadiSam system protein B [Steroidobacteraceae bacterium]|nr:AmmeMemoRadiSam system protein B [Steroidobacteraceae bacterium]
MSALAMDRFTVRPPSAAGLYYPKDADGLRHALRTLLSATTSPVARMPKALVVPHAGYAYSGPVAASAYHTLESAAARRIRHVVLLGPSHRVPMRGLAMPSCEYFSTPVGNVRVHDEARQRLRELGLAGIDDAPHRLEHSLEVQLPFLQAVLEDFDLLPIAVGSAPAEQVCRVLEAVWGGPETLIVVSTDLSHYHTYVEAQALDEQTTRLILARRSDISDAQACGAGGLNGLMEAARHKALQVELLDRRTSGDASGDNSRVVGYGSFALYEPD